MDMVSPIPLSAYDIMILTENGEERMCGGCVVVRAARASCILPATNRSTHRSFLAFRSLSQTQSWRETATPQQKSMGEEDIQENQFPHSMFTSLEKMQKDLSLHFSFSFYPPSASSAFLHHHRQCIMISWRMVMAMKSSLAVCTTIVLRHLLW
jgi:hypothetical protein